MANRRNERKDQERRGSKKPYDKRFPDKKGNV